MINLDYRYDKTQHKDLLGLDRLVDKVLNFSVCENVYFLPRTIKGKSGGAYDCKGNLISETATNLEYGCLKYDVESIDNYEQISGNCIYLGVYEPTWGHFITDCIKKVWFLRHTEARNYLENDDCQLLFLSEKASKLGDNHRRLLELMGVDVGRIKLVNKNSFASKVVIPDSCFFYDDKSVMHYTKQYVELIDSIKAQFSECNDKKYERIYYSYSSYQKRKGYKKTFGEEKLDRFFKDQGYQIVHPEDYSLDEQLRMLASCKYFASTEGSVGHNSLFLKDGCQVLIIPRGPYFSGYQQTIDTIGDHKIYYVDSSLSALTSKAGPWSGPNYYYVSEELMSFFELSEDGKEKYRKKNFYDINSYLRYCLVNLGGREYYTNNIYTEKFFYYLGCSHSKVFPLYSLWNLASDVVGYVWRKIKQNLL